MTKKTFFALLWLGLKAFRGQSRYSPRSMVELARLKASLLYVKSIQTARLLYISMMGIGICLVLFMGSLILFHTTVFVYTPLSMETKMWIGFGFAFLYFVIAVKAFSVVFSESQWLKIFHAAGLMEELTAAHDDDDPSVKGFQRNNKSAYKESGSHN